MPAPFPYLPSRDADLLAWSLNFAAVITASPASYGLTAGQATTFTVASGVYELAYTAAVNPPTRTKSTVATKNAARADLLVLIRSYMAIAQAYPAVTPSDLEDAGLTIRKTTPTPIGPPATSPRIVLQSTQGLGIDFRYSDESTPDSRSRPFGSTGMELWAKVGPVAPVSIADCVYKGLYTINTNGPGSRAAKVSFDGADVGKTAYFFGRWINQRGEPGPSSPLVSMTIAA